MSYGKGYDICKKQYDVFDLIVITLILKRLKLAGIDINKILFNIKEGDCNERGTR